MDIAEIVGRQIRASRKAAKLKQAALAEAIGRSEDAVSQFERGKTLPSIETLIALSNALSVSVDHLLGREENDDLAQAVQILQKLDERTLKVSTNILRAIAEGSK